MAAPNWDELSTTPPAPSWDDLSTTPPSPSTAGDVATQVAGHLAELPENIISAPAQLSRAIGHGITYLANKIAPNSDYVKQMTQGQADQDKLAASAQAGAPLVSNVVPEAKTPEGKAAGYLTDFLPGAALPGTIMQRLGRVLKPAAYSAGAGAVADQVAPDYAPAARIAGAMLGSKGSEGEPIKASQAFDVADKNYSDFRNADVSLSPATVSNWAKGLQTAMYNNDFESSPAYGKLAKYAAQTDPMPLSKLQVLHERLVQDSGAPGSDGGGARFAKAALEDFIPKLQPSDAVNNAQNLPGAIASWQAGTKNSFVANTMKAVEDAQEKARLNNMAAFTGDNADNQLRQQINSLLKNTKTKNRFANFRPQAEDVVEGNTGLNIARRINSFVNGHNNFLAPLMLNETFGLPAGIAGGLAVKTGGVILNKMQRAAQQQGINRLQNAISSQGVGLPSPGPSVNPWLARLLSGGLAASQQ